MTRRSHPRLLTGGEPLAVQPNLVVGGIGLLLALSTGTVMVAAWDDLIGLETWNVAFSQHIERLPERAGSVQAAGTATERVDVANANATTARISLTWNDPAVSQPTVRLRVVAPDGSLLAEESHVGGARGIHLELQLIDADDIPAPSDEFEARASGGDQIARAQFETRWPTRDEHVGTWTLEISSTAAAGPAPSGAVSYNLRMDYDYYEGTFTRNEAVTR